ncbi:FAD-binding oxidoreductase [Sulfitobacter albidus]|uniref:FAD-binding oxidoreductase n=1 Tax=Sulfitobacter albidus TaxID=2829501 RepID=A0A975PM63_9RHOB|nr:FAD-binding oxidoreductase [Sulfitobacter albidus]QUJ75905.1 FAD-binding oxidoreductase [Sulfitobacter albidus]
MTDLTIRGAGIFGLSIAWEATLRGAQVTLIDPHGPGAGSSGGIVGALAPHVPENWNPKKAFQLDSLLMAEGFWAAVAEAGGADPGYARTGRLQAIADDAGLVLARRRAQTARDLWGDHARWEVTSDTPDWAPVSATGYTIFDTLSAHLHPRRACDALVAALATKGVRVTPDGPERGIVIDATGAAGLHRLAAAHSRSMGAGVKGQAALLAHDARGLPQLFANAVHIIPHLDGTVAIGSTSEREFTDLETDAQLDGVIATARAAVPALREAQIIDRWAGIRPRARTRAPMLGPDPFRPGHFIANGGFKIGFGMAPKVATTMVDLILEGRDTIPEGFRLEDNL